MAERTRFKARVETRAVLAIPCKSHQGDLRVLAAIGQPVRTHGAVSGTKAMGIDPKKQKTAKTLQGGSWQSVIWVLIDLSKEIVAEAYGKSKDSCVIVVMAETSFGLFLVMVTKIYHKGSISAFLNIQL